jgi:hypothetical protein
VFQCHQNSVFLGVILLSSNKPRRPTDSGLRDLERLLPCQGRDGGISRRCTHAQRSLLNPPGAESRNDARRPGDDTLSRIISPAIEPVTEPPCLSLSVKPAIWRDESLPCWPSRGRGSPRRRGYGVSSSFRASIHQDLHDDVNSSSVDLTGEVSSSSRGVARPSARFSMPPRSRRACDERYPGASKHSAMVRSVSKSCGSRAWPATVL